MRMPHTAWYLHAHVWHEVKSMGCFTSIPTLMHCILQYLCVYIRYQYVHIRSEGSLQILPSIIAGFLMEIPRLMHAFLC